MCGIAGFSFAPSVKRRDAKALARSLLLGIEERGRDATGMAWHDAGELWFHKDGITASKFVDYIDDFNARTAILHTRYATLGSPKDPVNNHPIENNGIVGVHNGVIHNHDAVFDMLDDEVGGQVQRYGDVDSEAIFAMLAWRAAFDAEVGDLLSLLDGSAAIAWLEQADSHVLHLARVTGSPLWIGYTKRGSLMFASTKNALQKAAMAGGFRFVQLGPLPEGTHVTVRDGKVTDVESFDVTKRVYVKPQYGRPSRFERRSALSSSALTDWRADWRSTTVANEPFDDYVNGDLTWDDYLDKRWAGR